MNLDCLSIAQEIKLERLLLEAGTKQCAHKILIGDYCMGCRQFVKDGNNSNSLL